MRHRFEERLDVDVRVFVPPQNAVRRSRPRVSLARASDTARRLSDATRSPGRHSSLASAQTAVTRAAALTDRQAGSALLAYAPFTIGAQAGVKLSDASSSERPGHTAGQDAHVRSGLLGSLRGSFGFLAMADVFISFPGATVILVLRLVEALEARGKDVWLDTEGHSRRGGLPRGSSLCCGEQ